MVGYKTSVIIPVYNTEQYLDECIRSVLNQTQKEVEVILVDDGSTDRSYEIMLSYEREYSDIKVFHQENKKLGAARNLGMRYAGGKYAFFLDSDDYIKENCLEELYECAERNRLEFVTYDSEIFVECAGEEGAFPEYDRSALGIAEDRVYRGRDFLNGYFGVGGVFVSACMAYYNVDFLRKHQISFEEQVYYEDNEFSLKVYYSAERMMYLPQKLYVRRYRENSIMTSDCGLIHLQSAVKMSEKCLRILLQMPVDTENKEGIRAVIAILTNRLLGQMRSYQNKEELIHNRYILDLCRFFTACDEKAVVSNLGLELAFEFYSIFSELIEAGCLLELAGLKDQIQQRLAVLGHRIKETINRLLTGWGRQEDKIIIYGTGDVAERIVHCYRTICQGSAVVEKRVIFAKSKTGNDSVYLGKYPVRQIDQIGADPISMIIIASTKYEREMCARLDWLYGGKYPYVTYREIANISLDGEK